MEPLDMYVPALNRFTIPVIPVIFESVYVGAVNFNVPGN